MVFHGIWLVNVVDPMPETYPAWWWLIEMFLDLPLIITKTCGHIWGWFPEKKHSPSFHWGHCEVTIFFIERKYLERIWPYLERMWFYKICPSYGSHGLQFHSYQYKAILGEEIPWPLIHSKYRQDWYWSKLGHVFIMFRWIWQHPQMELSWNGGTPSHHPCWWDVP